VTAEPNLPANPLSIELTTTNRRLWWPESDEDGQPEKWDVSADVWDLDLCAEEERHVADIGLAIADLTRTPNLLDSVVLGEWALDFISGMVSEPDSGRLHPELEAKIGHGPPRLVVLRRLSVAEPWRGHGLGAALVAGALRAMAPMARLAACRVSRFDFRSSSPDRISAELTSVRAGTMLEGIGFCRWHGVHIVDPRSPRLSEAPTELLNKWWPPPQAW
jgi:GNAT superfamily N-acetyltransferase